MIKYFSIFFLMCTFFMPLQLIYAQHAEADFWDGVIYVKIKSAHPYGVLSAWDKEQDKDNFLSACPTMQKLSDLYGFTTIKKPFRTASLKNIYKIYFTKINEADALIRELITLSYIEYACKSPIYRSYATPNDAHLNQWYLSLIQAFDAWDITTGNAHVKVAIVDDAVKISHPDLLPIIYTNPYEALDGTDTDGNGFVDDINGWDVANNDNNPEPPASHWMYQFSNMIFTHGTHCAGIAGAATNNNIGIASIGYGISIIPVKCTKDDAIIPLALDAGPEGIDYAIAAGADVISLSWGSAQNVQVVQDAVNAALAEGIIITAAAGNDGNTNLMYPASITGVISVGAITKNDIIASFSQRNDKVSVMAPGDSIWSCQRENSGYMFLEGTSMACPMVAGLAGLMKSLDTNFTAAQIKACLLAGCDNIDAINPSAAGLMGAGRINAYKSLLCLQSQQSIKTLEKSLEVLIFPNPASNFVFINLSGLSKVAYIHIHDIKGQKQIEYPVAQNKTAVEINTSNLSSGIYIVTVYEAMGLVFRGKIAVKN